MKAILMSIQPQYVTKILNGEKTIEIRKKFPKDYVGWVYIYCTKDKQLVDCPQWVENELYHQLWCDKNIALLENSQALLNGKVVARFWCDKVEEINNRYCRGMLIDSCLTNHELNDYLGNYQGKAIRITKLEIFDKPKELSEFNHLKKVKCEYIEQYDLNPRIYTKIIQDRLTKAPQSWCYVGV